jgi:hypothetical protein
MLSLFNRLLEKTHAQIDEQLKKTTQSALGPGCSIATDLFPTERRLRRDVRMFFSLPVPKAVWTKTKLLQNQDFAAFIDSSLS